MERWASCGSEGMLVAQNTIFQLPTDLWHYRHTSDGFADCKPEEVEYTPVNIHEAEIRLFSETVESRSPNQISGEAGLYLQPVVDTIYRSSAERRDIALGFEASA